MEVLNKGHPIRGWPTKADVYLPNVFNVPLVRGKKDRRAGITAKVFNYTGRDGPQSHSPRVDCNRKPVPGMIFRREPGTMSKRSRGLQKIPRRLPRGEPQDLERAWKTVISNYIVRTGEVRAGPVLD